MYSSIAFNLKVFLPKCLLLLLLPLLFRFLSYYYFSALSLLWQTDHERKLRTSPFCMTSYPYSLAQHFCIHCLAATVFLLACILEHFCLAANRWSSLVVMMGADKHSTRTTTHTQWLSCTSIESFYTINTFFLLKLLRIFVACIVLGCVFVCVQPFICAWHFVVWFFARHFHINWLA